MKKKILIVFGTRPEAIKMAPVVKEFQKYPGKFDTIVCVTAQHREMLDQVLKIFEIQPDHDLNIMKKGQDLYDITSRILLSVKNVLEIENPDIVFVHGDTTTSSTVALASYYKQIPVAHVEAGLRTYNLYSPWPEEINRQITGRIATYHFAPTELSKRNLLDERINEASIIVTGNTVIDALFMIVEKIKNVKELKDDVKWEIQKEGYQLNKNKKFILVTGHRRENFGQGFLNICKALNEIAQQNPDFDIIYPVHLNPNVQKPVKDILENVPNIFLIEPLNYLPFVFLLSKCYIVITDSGGIQEEAPSLGKPVLVMRDTTERPEALDAGTVILVGTDKEKIINETQKLISNHNHYEKLSKAHNPYGDGKAAERIVNSI